MKNQYKKGIQKQLKDAYLVKPLNNEKLQDTVHQSKRLLWTQSKYKYAILNLVAFQVRNISMFFWLVQFICFGLFVIGSSNVKDMDSIQTLFLTVSPIMAFYILPELYRSKIYNMFEVEASCFHNPAKIVGIKIMLVSISNIIVIFMMSLFLAIFQQLDIWEILCRGLIPFNITVAITLVLFGFMRIQSPYAVYSVAVLLTIVLTQFSEIGVLMSSFWNVLFPVSLLAVIGVFCITIYRINKVGGIYNAA